MKSNAKRAMSILLSFVLVTGLTCGSVPGAKLTAYADETEVTESVEQVNETREETPAAEETAEGSTELLSEEEESVSEGNTEVPAEETEETESNDSDHTSDENSAPEPNKAEETVSDEAEGVSETAEEVSTEDSAKAAPGSSSDSVTWSGATEITSAKTTTGETYSSTTASQNAVLISTDENVTLTSPTVTKSGGTSAGDDESFYGINSAVMCKGGGTTTITGAKITTEAPGANGVFSYGGNATTNATSGDGTKVVISDSTITTTGNGSGGIMTTGQGITQASNLTVQTSGDSSAAIRSDRGGGTVTVDKGTYETRGTGSPAIYATATINVSNAVLTSTNSQGVVNEGGNTVILEECEVNAGNATLGSQDNFRNGIFLYQSMSGDASDGASVFTMTGGAINNTYGHVFHVTNTSANITLEEVEINNSDSEDVLISVCDDAWSGLDNEAVINATNQTLEGKLLVGSDDSLTVNLSGTSAWTGTTSGEITSHKDSSTISSSLGTVAFVLSDTATIKLSADTTISSLSGEGYIDYNGYTLTVGSKSYSSGDIGDVKEVSGEESTHTHSFTYDASDAVIIATCSAENCTLTDNKVTLTLVAPTLTTYGGSGSESASLTGLSDFNKATDKSIAETDIVYYAATKDGTTYTKSGAALSAAPTDAGDYVAEITVEEKTASVGYTIGKGAGSISYATTAVSKSHGDSAFTNTLTHTGDGTVTYASSDTSVATVDASTGKVTITGIGEATITATVSGGTNYDYETTTASYTLTVSEKQAVSYTVTFKVANGYWNDGTTANKTVTLTGYEGDTLKLSSGQIPSVGSNPKDNYKAGSWDTTPSTEKAITSNTTYTYTYAKKSKVSVTVTFKVVNGSWNDKTTEKKTVTLTGYEGDTLKLSSDDIPEVGSNPNNNYKKGSWDEEPSTKKAITENTTYTYTYASKTSSSSSSSSSGSSTSAKTGDNSMIWLWGLLFAASAAGLVAIVVKKQGKKN